MSDICLYVPFKNLVIDKSFIFRVDHIWCLVEIGEKLSLTNATADWQVRFEYVYFLSRLFLLVARLVGVRRWQITNRIDTLCLVEESAAILELKKFRISVRTNFPLEKSFSRLSDFSVFGDRFEWLISSYQLVNVHVFLVLDIQLTRALFQTSATIRVAGHLIQRYEQCFVIQLWPLFLQSLHCKLSESVLHLKQLLILIHGSYSACYLLFPNHLKHPVTNLN
jgi:hypothetical protein